MNILIADDHPIVRQGLIKIIEGSTAFRIIAEAGDGRDALRLILEHQPDIAVLDLSMPGLSGIEVAKEILGMGGKTRFVIMTMYKDEDYFNEALDSGVMGYVLKESAVTDLSNCLDAVAVGRYFVSPFISDYLIRRDREKMALRQKAPALSELTPMERRILSHVAENHTSRDIASELGISYRTVQNHRNNIIQKLGLSGHNTLLTFALQNKALLQ